MAQHDYVIANQSGAAFRADLNNALAAIVSQNSGAAEPSTTYAYMPWADTINGLFKIRNAANSDWITLYQLDGELSTIAGADELVITTAGVERVNFNGSSEVVFNDVGADIDFRIEGDTEPNLFKIDAGTDQVQVKNLNGGPLAGTRNRIINGGMAVDQRHNGSSLSSGVDAITYSVDRWYVYALGAAVTAQRVGSSAALYQNALRINGAASNAFVSVGQRIEVANSFDLADQVVTLSFVAASSASISLTWSILYADAPDDFGSKTTARTGTQATTQSMTRYSATFTLPANAYTGLAVEFQVANFTSGSIDITGVQLEPGSVATPFERRSYGQELALCQRYYEGPIFSSIGGVTSSGTGLYNSIYYAVTKRATPTVTQTAASLVGSCTSYSADSIYYNGIRATATNTTGGNGIASANFFANAEL